MVKDEKISKISIVFDKKKLELFKKIIEKETSLLQLKDENDFLTIQNIQQELREKMKKMETLFTYNDYPFNLSTKPYNFPNMYALFLVLILPNLDNCNSWLDIINKVKKDAKLDNYSLSHFDDNYHENTYNDSIIDPSNNIVDDNTKSDFLCCCGHYCLPDNQFLVIYNYSILVGSSCILKEKLFNKEDIKTLKLSKEEIKKNKELSYLKINIFPQVKNMVKVKRFQKKMLIKKVFHNWKEQIRLIKIMKQISRKRICKYVMKYIKKIKNILGEFVDLKKVKDCYKNISYYRFFQKAKKNIEWKRYITYCLSPKASTNLNTQIKLQKYKKIYL